VRHAAPRLSLTVLWLGLGVIDQVLALQHANQPSLLSIVVGVED
jgi:hypothetical protein